MKNVWIVQPYVPRYRVPFFELLFEHCARQDIAVHVIASPPDGDQAARGDSASPRWLTTVRPRKIRLGKRSLTLTSTKSTWAQAEGVIVPHMGSSLDTYSALLGRDRARRAGVWGHIKPYTAAPNPIDIALETYQLRRADHVFAYTQGGTDYAISKSIDPSKITTVMNTLDTSHLTSALSHVEDFAASEVARRLAHLAPRNLIPSKTFCFIGGLDSSKRIDFLADCLDLVWSSDPEIHVLVGGQGADSHLLDRAAKRGQLSRLGYVDDETKALISKSSVAILSPGRIGLVAVEALVLGLPVLTTDWAYHAPEAEYLVEGASRVTSANTPEAYAELIALTASQPASLHSAAGLMAKARQVPTLEEMTIRFTDGVARMLGG